MHPRGILFAALGVASLTSIAPPAGAEGETEPPPDPAVVAEREARPAADEPIATDPPLVQDDQASPPDGTRAIRDLYYLDATSTAGGYIRVFARDNPAQDKPGTVTTTVRIYGNAAAFRNGPGPIKLHSTFTCSGAGISGLTVGSGGVSVSGGSTSSTLTWDSSRSSSSEVRQYYTEGGHFRCKASNATFAKTTRRGTASTTYKTKDTRAEDAYSFTW